MTIREMVDYLRTLADATLKVANDEGTNRGSRVRLTMQASVLLEACDTLLGQGNELAQLRDRLLRQACYFEQFEARAEPPTWPLLDDDCDDSGVAL